MQERDRHADSPSDRSRIFVGDVHGCADELDDLLSAIDHDPQRHELWFVGDLVNRGPHSARVVRRVMALAAGTVLGNHDLHALACAAGARGPRPGDTLEDLLDADDREQLLAWLRARPLLKLWPDVALVHAGLHPHWHDLERVAAQPGGLAAAEVELVTRVRTCTPDGQRPAPGDTGTSAASGPFAPWYQWYRGRRTVVFGHWAQAGLVVQERLRGLDTGCVYGGRLTAWIAERDRIVSVPARRTYVTPAS